MPRLTFCAVTNPIQLPGIPGQHSCTDEATRSTEETMSVTSTAVPLASAVLACWMWAVLHASGAQAPDGLPGRLGDYITQHVKLSPDQYRQLLQGAPVTQPLAGDSSKEVAI